jgi:hypothetical protein
MIRVRATFRCTALWSNLALTAIRVVLGLDRMSAYAKGDIGRHDQLPQAGASMKRRAFLWILGWAVPHNITTPTTIIGQATIAALSIRRTY